MTGLPTHTAAARFEAARQLDGVAAGHRLGRPHGHGFIATVRTALAPGFGGFAGAEVGALRDALASAVAPLDYSDLNARLEDPSDAGIARWIHRALALPSPTRVGVQSTPAGGTEVDAEDRLEVWRRYALESAHRLPHVPPGHKCGRVHGHRFEVVLRAACGTDPVAAQAMADALDGAWSPIHAALDHAYLNDLPGLENPTSEQLSGWLWRRLRPVVPTLTWVTVYETGQSGSSHDGTRYRIWRDLVFDSATRLESAPAGDPRRAVHGHRYTLRVHLCAPLDPVLGWTVDFGDVKAAIAPIYHALDHQPLHEVMERGAVDTAALARWVHARAAPLLTALDGVAVYEAPGAGSEVLADGAAPALPL